MPLGQPRCQYLPFAIVGSIAPIRVVEAGYSA